LRGAQETRCFEALADLYGALNETEVLAGAWQRRGAADETRAALSCLQPGQLERAQALLADALRRAAGGWPAYPGASPFHLHRGRLAAAAPARAALGSRTRGALRER